MLSWPDVVYLSMIENGIPIDPAAHGAIYWRTVMTFDPEKDFDRRITK
jgi:hypothetical protein